MSLNNNMIQLMKHRYTKTPDTVYTAPVTEVMDFCFLSILCQSPSDTEDFGRNDDSENWFAN